MLTLLALLAGAAPAPHATLSAPPRPLISGRAWNATLVVKPAPRTRPKVVARPPSGRSLVFSTRRVGRGRYKVRLVLPRVGRWTVSARIGGRLECFARSLSAPLPPPTSPLPGGTAYRVCGGAREPFLQYGLTIGYGSAWVACREQRAVQRIDLATGRVLRHDRRDRAGRGRSRPEKAPCGRSRFEARPSTASIPGRTESRRRSRSVASCRTPGREAAPCGRPTTRGRP